MYHNILSGGRHNMNLVGITERGDAALDQSWRNKLDTVSGVILITKAPQSLGVIPVNAIVHCTITGYGGTVIEPGVADPLVTLEAYDKLVDEFGGERTVLRIDPIIPTLKGIARALEIFNHAKGRVRISFLDAYPHVRERFHQQHMKLPWDEIHWPLPGRRRIAEMFPGAEICGEPGLECTGCVSMRDMAALKMTCQLAGACSQRAACACAANKTELLTRRGQCAHGCLYCYWK
jgi:DNA repair photolyase